MFQNLHTFSERGKVVACAFAVSGSFALASNLAFVAGVQPQMMGYMLLAKMVAGLSALALALFVTRKSIPSSSAAVEAGASGGKENAPSQASPEKAR